MIHPMIPMRVSSLCAPRAVAAGQASCGRRSPQPSGHPGLLCRGRVVIYPPGACKLPPASALCPPLVAPTDGNLVPLAWEQVYAEAQSVACAQESPLAREGIAIHLSANGYALMALYASRAIPLHETTLSEGSGRCNRQGSLAARQGDGERVSSWPSSPSRPSQPQRLEDSENRCDCPMMLHG
jgi:hypothetical protein